MKLYKIAHHEEVFGDSKPRTVDEIYQKIFGYAKTDSIESWPKDPRFLKEMDLATLENYCIEPGSMQEYGKLIEDIRKNGMKVPLVVFKTPEGHFQVVEGHHRAGAAKMLGFKTVSVFLMEEQ